MERMIMVLNLLSAVIMLVTGIYIQVAFAAVLSPTVRVVIVASVLAYFLIRLEQFIAREIQVT